MTSWGVDTNTFSTIGKHTIFQMQNLRNLQLRITGLFIMF